MSELTPLARRAALRLIVGAPALAILPSAMSAELPPQTLAPDPVFAAIGLHKAAWAAFVKTVGPLDDVEGDQEGTKEEAAYLDASVAADDALEDFLDTPPITMPGLRAFLKYVLEIDSGCLHDSGGRIAEVLLESPLIVSRTSEDLADA
jgi:hypothetical protein